MSKATLKTRITRLAQTLNHGFALDGAFRLRRKLPYIDQFIEIQPGGGSLDGMFTGNLCWLFTADGTSRDDVYHHVVRLGALTGGTDLWLSHEPKQALEASWEKFTQLLNEFGLPFLDSLTDLRQMVVKYENALANDSGPPASSASPLLFFGMDDGWRHYNLGFAYRALGDDERSQHHLQLVITKYSDHPYEWVQKRRQMCESALAHSVSA